MSTEAYDKVRGFIRKTQLCAICAGAIIGLTLACVWSIPIGIGFLVGAAASVVNFQFMAVDAYEIPGKTPGGSRRFIIGRYLIRYAILFVFLMIVVTKTRFNFLATFAGLFIVQLLLILERVYQTAVLALKTIRG